MPELNLPMTRGDTLGRGSDYRDALPVNTVTVMRKIFDMEGYVSTHPGLGNFATAPGRDRGAVYNERLKKHLRISGNSLIELTYDGTVGDFEIPQGTATIIGGISGTDDEKYSQASMPYSFNTQAIITDLKMWLYDGTTLDEVIDVNLGLPIDCVWINGYYFLTDGENLYHTELNDESSIEPLDFATSEFSPDPTVGLIKTQDNQVMVLNRYTTEYFYNEPSISAGFAFLRIQGKAINAGIVGTHLKCVLGGTVFCLGSGKEESPTMLVLGPGQVGNFSTREIDKIIGEYTEEELANGGVMETRTEDRDELIYVRLPRHTLCYNHTAAKVFGKEFAWSIMKSGVTDDAPWDAVNGVYDVAGNGWIYGDRTKSRIGILTTTISAQYGVDMETIFYTPIVKIEAASIDEIEFETIPGYTFDESFPVFFSMGYDGHTFGREISVEYGGFAEYNNRFILYRLGYIRNYFNMKVRAVTKWPLVFARLIVKYG